jgi:hypothetical protein
LGIDFLAGANLDHGDPEMLLFSMTRVFKFLPGEHRQAFLEGLTEKASLVQLAQNSRACGWIQGPSKPYDSRSCVAMAGGFNRAARCQTWKFTTKSFAANWGRL